MLEFGLFFTLNFVIFDVYPIITNIIASMNRIKEILAQKGVKQKWLAEQLEKSYNVVNGYVQNRKQPRLETLYKIAEILEVNPKELLIEPETKNENN